MIAMFERLMINTLYSDLSGQISQLRLVRLIVDLWSRVISHSSDGLNADAQGA